MQVKTLDSLAASGVLKDKRVLIRSDLNVPRNDEGAITNDARIVASLPAIKTALLAGAAVMVTSHLGRPKGKILCRSLPIAWGNCLAEKYRLFRIGSTALR